MPAKLFPVDNLHKESNHSLSMSLDQAPLLVTPETKIGAVLSRYGDIAEVMESFGVKPVGRFNIRRLVGKVLNVRMAAKIHKLETSEMVDMLQKAINQVHETEETK